MRFQESLGREIFEYPSPEHLVVQPLSKEVQPPPIRAKIIKHELQFGKNYLYIPHGPVTDFNQMIGGFKNPVANFVKWLCELGRSQKSIFIKAEPLADSVAQALVGAGFRKSKKEIQPSKTIIINLSKSEDELLTSMHHKTRYNIGVADKHGVVVSENGDLDSFMRLLKKTAKRDNFNMHPADYYKKLLNYNGLQTKLYFAKHNGQPPTTFSSPKVVGGEPIAAALVLIYGDTAYYLHGASDYKYRSLMAPYALHWHIIKQLQTTNHKLQTKYYDLWGIDARKWPGITRFKFGWGGRIVEYPGSFDLPISRFWYLIYQIARKMF